MRILVDILHPAHVHVFRHFLAEMEKRGHRTAVASRHKDVTCPLLDACGIVHRPISRAPAGAAGLAAEWILRSTRLARFAGEFRPDVLTGCMGPVLAGVGIALRIPTVVLYNNEMATLANGIAQPLARAYVTSTSFRGPVRGRHFTHESYHELAYLHPDRFRPSGRGIPGLGPPARRPRIVVRLVAFRSSHDRGVRGLGDPGEAVRRLSAHGEVIVSSERDVPPELQPYRCDLPPDRVHDLLAHAGLQIGESATMAAEAAVLGVPSFYVGSSPRGYLRELEERYGLVRHVPTSDRALDEAIALLQRGDASATWRRRRERMLAEKVDLTAWLVRFFEEERWRKGT